MPADHHTVHVSPHCVCAPERECAWPGSARGWARWGKKKRAVRRRLCCERRPAVHGGRVAGAPCQNCATGWGVLLRRAVAVCSRVDLAVCTHTLGLGNSLLQFV